MVRGVTRVAAITFFCLGTVGYVRAFGPLLRQLVPQTALWTSFLSGAAAFCLIWFLWLSRRPGFWSILEHELTHALFALLFLKRIHALRVQRRQGGAVTMESGNVVIALAPYFFPLLTACLLLLKPMVRPGLNLVWNALLGFSLAFHWVSLLQEFHPSQPDIRYAGLLTSLSTVVFFNLFFLGLTLAALPEQGHLVHTFLRVGLQNALATAQDLWCLAETTLFGVCQPHVGLPE